MARPVFVMTCLLLVTAFVLAPAALGQSDAGKIAPEKMKKLSDQLDRTIDQYITWLTQIYQMTPDQQQQVRQKLQTVKQEHLNYGQTAASEMQPLQQELRYYIEKARKGEPVDKEMVKELQGRLQAVIEKAPLTFNNVIVQTESVLPEEQVLAGRERQKEFRERVKESGERSRRLAPPSPPGELDALKPYLDTGGQKDTVAKLPPPPVKPQAAGQEPVAPAAEPSKPAKIEALPLDAWGRYVEDFIARHELDAKQADQGRQILAELRKKAGEYRSSHKNDYAQAEQIQEVPARAQALSQLDKPIQDMFEELRTRLEGIPTDAQRKLAEAAGPGKTATSQPAKAPTSRPAVASAPASRPAIGNAPASRPAVTNAPTSRPAAKVAGK